MTQSDLNRADLLTNYFVATTHIHVHILLAMCHNVQIYLHVILSTHSPLQRNQMPEFTTYEKNSGLLHINYFDKAIKSSILEVSRRWQQDSITKMRVCSVTARKLRLLTQPPGPSLQTSCYWACWFSWHHVTHTHVLHCYALANLFSSFSMKVYIQ